MSYPKLWDITNMVYTENKYIKLGGVEYQIFAERFDIEGQVTFLFLNKEGSPRIGVWQDNYPELGVYSYILNALNPE